MPPPLTSPPDPPDRTHVNRPFDVSSMIRTADVAASVMTVGDTPSGLECLLDTIAASKNRDGSVTISGPTFAALVNMVHEMQKDSRRIEDKLRTHEAQLNELDAQKMRLDELHRKIDMLTAGARPVHPLPANPSSWANVATSSRAADKEPFADASLAKIVDDVNFALMNIDAWLPNSESTIQVKGAA
ncbi:hypothetical protein CROQUDRAFT_111507 [Cronartium quercuum f. sp. fusiforme G11]|uniref:Uncharacterized protein n=1 Tax=Cronartium quercuum f. sp. fusiforme G11 TaxID=708437 RepID=A0A9P6N6E8_9BASI|nr:hypothetical protein CROQUDRAFT_111507 [Cronartium quercuum f. sp. fusiforme G11]